MIVRDEEANLPRALQSIHGLFDEIVVVDTGSRDRTVEIAREFGARVFRFTWIDDFAAARNAALAHVTGDYALWLDADDLIEPAERKKFEGLLEHVRGAQPLGGLPQRGTGIHGRSQSPFASACSGKTGTGVLGRSQSPLVSTYVIRCACDPGPGGSNDQRAAFKQRINEMLGSAIVEEKSYNSMQ